MTPKDAKNGKASKNGARAKKKVPRRLDRTVQDLAARQAGNVKGGVPKQPDNPRLAY